MKPPCLKCLIHANSECKFNVFCMYHCQARITYCRYIDKLIRNSYLAVDPSDQELRYHVEPTDDVKDLLQEIYFQE